MAKVSRFTQDNQSPVGMIVHSMLTETQFQAINGVSWVLADGRSVAGSIYATTTGSSSVPDLRGVFLRGKNNSRADGNQDPGGDRALGSVQTHAFGNHDHGGGSHGHYVGSQDSTADTGGNVAQEFVRSYNSGSGGKAYTSAPTTLGTTTAATVIQEEGGLETRPTNIAVNVFIKIN
jgi:hypothetical protein